MSAHGNRVHGHAASGTRRESRTYASWRSDVQRELVDPGKADHVGKFCDFWWLVVSDLKIIDGLVVPSTWGILVPKQGVLRIHRKAPKREAVPITRGFAAALVRKVTESWVPRVEFEALKEKQRSELLAELEKSRAYVADDAARELARLKQRIETFEKASGVSIDEWRSGDVGDAVRIALDLRNNLGREALARQAEHLERTSSHHDHLASTSRRSAAAIRELLGGDQQTELSLVDAKVRA